MYFHFLILSFVFPSVSQGVQGMFLSEVDPSGVAAKAGVQNNDRLIELNGDNVESSNHEQIVDKVTRMNCLPFSAVELHNRYHPCS